MSATGQRFLEGRLALVTAGARNLGAATSHALASAGADVVVNYHSSANSAAQLVESLPPGQSGHIALQGDAGTPNGIRQLIADAEQRVAGRPIEILVNNFGPFSMTPFAELPEDEWERVLSANVKAAFVAVQEVAPQMIRNEWGRVINMSAGSAYLRNHSIYSLAKDAVIGLTESLAVELGPFITVNAVTPGQIAESAEDIAEFDPDFVDRAIDHTPLGRLVTRPEVAAIIAQLCGPLFDGVTGITIPVDGGWHLPRL